MYPNRLYIYKYISTTISQKLERRNINIRQNQLREFGKPRSMLSGASCLHFNHPNHSSLGSRQFFTVWLCFDYPAPVYTRRRLALTYKIQSLLLEQKFKNLNLYRFVPLLWWIKIRFTQYQYHLQSHKKCVMIHVNASSYKIIT